MNFTELKGFSAFISKKNDYSSLNISIHFNNIDLLLNHDSISNEIVLHNTFIDDFRESISNDIQENIIINHFLFLRQATITSFFVVNMIDMPICFKKSKSLYSKTFELPLLKFTNLIMRHGMREKILKNTTLSFICFFHKFFQKSNLNYNKWYSVYNFLSNITLDSGNLISSRHLKKTLDLNSKHLLSEDGFSFNNSLFFKKKLFDKLNEYIPLFSFYIRKVDKSIRKNSRGKSGKYTII